MMKTLIVQMLLVAAFSGLAEPLQWICEWPKARAQQFELYQGEIATFEPSFRINDGAPTNLPVVTVWYQTNGMDRTWWHTEGAVFHPSNDVGAASYRFFVDAAGVGGKIYRANGTLRMLPSPGFVPNVLAPPVATIEETAPAPGNYATVSNRAMTALQSYTETDPTVPGWAKDESKPSYTAAEVGAIPIKFIDSDGIIHTDEFFSFDNDVIFSPEAALSIPTNWLFIGGVRYTGVSTFYNDAGYLTDDDLSGVALSGDYNDLDNTPPIPTTAADVGAADAASFAVVSTDVASISASLNAENARFVSTNYNSSALLAEASVEAKVDGSWIVIWREMTRWNWFLYDYLPTNYYDKAAINRALDDKADRAWGFYDPMTGNYAPDDCIWLSAPRVYVCAGMSYQRVADTRGYWVLTSNGMVADLSGTTNGFFRISDSDGETQFEIVKGDKQTLGAKATVMSHEPVMGVTHYFTSYAVTNAVSAPTAAFSRSLDTVAWISEYDPLCPCNVEWAQSGAAEWTCEWWPKSDEPTVFMMVQYERGGETYINNVAPVSMRYIYLGGVKYSLGTASISGNTVLTLTVAP